MKTNSLLILFALLLSIAIVSGASVSVNVTETTANSTVSFNGSGFLPNVNYSMTILMENGSSWWDGYDEQWGMPVDDNLTGDNNGNWQFNWTIPYDFRTSEGIQAVKVGQMLESNLYWSTQGVTWNSTILQQKNGITGDNDANGFIFTGNNILMKDVGGVEKIYKSNGSVSCAYNHSFVVNINDITNNGTYVYAVTSGNVNNLIVINMSNCARISNFTTAGAAAWSVLASPDNKYIIISYASSAPRMYNITNQTPIFMPYFNVTTYAFIGYDIAISPDSAVVYVGYSNGNVTAINASNGSVMWNRNPHADATGGLAQFPIYGVAADSDRVYTARGLIAVTGMNYQGFVDALNVSNGNLIWTMGKTDTGYDGANVNNIKCDTSYCYVVKDKPSITTGIAASTIWEINKTTGNVTWWNWRSWLNSSVYNQPYGTGVLHQAAQTLWIDNDTNGFIYPVYSAGWVQKIAKNDVNASMYPEANFWIKGQINFQNYFADVPKNIWLSNETPYYVFRHWDIAGNPLNVSNNNTLFGTLFRWSMLSTVGSITAYEYSVGSVLGNAVFIDPTREVTTSQRNGVMMYPSNAFETNCPGTRYGPGLSGWHYEDRSCQYEEIPARNASWDIGTTINGTFIAATTYALVKTKFWDNYPITEYYGKDNWAWAAMYNWSSNQTLGFATKFGADQEDVYSDNYGRAVLFINSATSQYYKPQFRADLNRKTDNYILFMPRGQEGRGDNVNFTWSPIDIETQKIAYPVWINLSDEEPGGNFLVNGSNFANRIQFTAQEPNLFNRTFEPVEIQFNATANVMANCLDIIVTNSSDTPIDLWQTDNSTNCTRGNNVSLWIMMNWTKNEVKNLNIYYSNISGRAIFPLGVTDLIVVNTTGSCQTNNQEINVSSSRWYNWTRPASATPAQERTRFNFGVNMTVDMWTVPTHFQVAILYKNSNSTSEGVGSGTDATSAVVNLVSRCWQTGGTGKIFVKINASASVPVIPARTQMPTNVTAEYYFFANTGRVRIRTQLNQSFPFMNTTVSKGWPPYYYLSMNNFIPPFGNNSWVYWSGLYDQMRKPVAVFNGDTTEANLSSSPLPMNFYFKYDGIDNMTDNNESLLRPFNASGNGTTGYWGEGCTAHKMWQYYYYNASQTINVMYGTPTGPFYTNEFISCSKDLAPQLPKMGQPGWVNVIPEMGWYELPQVNRWYDPLLIGKFYLKQNLWRPYNRESRFLTPYVGLATGPTTARISSYIVARCPTREYGYLGYDDFLSDLPNMLANSSLLIKNNTNNIDCAAQIIRWVDNKGSDGTQIIFAKNLTVIVGETLSAGWTYPFNTYAPGTYRFQPDGQLDMTLAQKTTGITGYYGKFYFTYTPNNYIMHTFSSQGDLNYLAVNALSGYTMRYNYSPDTFYQKNVFDTSSFYNYTAGNFSYYLNPCYLSVLTANYGYPLLTANITPGWQMNAYGATAQTCPHENYNKETYANFRPGFTSLYPTSTAATVQNEVTVDGKANIQGADLYPGLNDSYFVSRHNALWDDRHSDDYNAILYNYSDLNLGVKTPNEQPWYCQVSYFMNRSFCVMTSSTSSLVYNYNPGLGLTSAAAGAWSPYWQSAREMADFKDLYQNRWNTTNPMVSYNYYLDLALYPTLKSNEYAFSNLLLSTNNPQDYNLWFDKQFPFANDLLKQNQFLLGEWTNKSFILFDRDSRAYASGQMMNISGLVMYNGNYLSSSSFVLGVYNNSGYLARQETLATDASGRFMWNYTIPSNWAAGIYYIQTNYSGILADSASFKISAYGVSILTDRSNYAIGQSVSVNYTAVDYSTGQLVDPAVVQAQIVDSSGTVLDCSSYPGAIGGCGNVLSRVSTGKYSDTLAINSSMNSGDAVVTLTLTDNLGVQSSYTSNFRIEQNDISLIKNAVYASENSTAVTYNLTLQVINSGGKDASGILVEDSEMGVDVSVNMNRTQDYNASSQKTVNKGAVNQNYVFGKANATFDSVLYESNAPEVLIPALESGSSLTLSKTASVYSTNNSNIIYNVTLALTNAGGRNVTGIQITDANSTSSPYSIGTLSAGQTAVRSYLLNFLRGEITGSSTLNNASASGTDYMTGSTVSGSSPEIYVSIPAYTSNSSLSLAKTASFFSLDDSNITYNITLLVNNIGGRNATNVKIYDSNSTSSPYTIGTLLAGQNSQVSYLINFSRGVSAVSYTLSVAKANGTDFFNGNMVEINSSQISVLAPASSSSASLVLDKILSLYDITDSDVTYNITLKLTNKGGSNATGVNISDMDSPDLTYFLGKVIGGEIISRNYLITFAREHETMNSDDEYTHSLAVAQSFGVDIFSGNVMSANSTAINLSIPELEAEEHLNLIKNIEFLSENSTSLTYNVSIEIINSGGSYLGNISLHDTDLGLDSNISLDRLQSYSYSAIKNIARSSVSQSYTFSKASALYNSITYYSNQLSLGIPSYESSASFVLSKSASIYSLNSTGIVYNVTLAATNKGGRNITNAHIYDEDYSGLVFDVGTVISGQNYFVSYFLTFLREVSNTNKNLTIARVNGTDYLNGSLIQADSLPISAFVPATSSSASFVLDKIISLQVLNPTNIIYNITLKTTNKGGSNATGVLITDSDAPSSYSLGTLGIGSSNSTSYTKTYPRNSTNYNITLVIANANGTDSLNLAGISANSSQSVLIVPATTADTSISLVKNAKYLSENTTSVTYNLTLDFVNSGGTDLAGISVKDSEISLDGSVNLNRTLSYSTSGTKTISKTTNSLTYTFLKANATYGSTTYESNQLQILIPALESNSSLSLSKTASIYSSTDSNVTYNLTLTLTNKGGRNATNVYIYDSNSTDSPYAIGTLTAGQTAERSYLKTFDKTSSSANQVLAIATANATDSIDHSLIEAISNAVTVLIPARPGTASFVLDKIASFWNLTNETFTYNITLRLMNKGASNSSSTNISDADSSDLLYSLGTLALESSAERSYLKNFTRNSTTYSFDMGMARAFGLDINGNIISANSSLITVAVPSSTTAQQLTVYKSISHNSQTSSDVNYSVSLQIVNSGGVDLAGIVVTDDDLNISEIVNLNRTQAYAVSGSSAIVKTPTNQNHTFSMARASVNSIIYSSNQIMVLIPGYGNGPNDLIVNAPSSVNASSLFDSTIRIDNQNPDIGQDFTIDYWMTNQGYDMNYTTGARTLFVSASGSNTTIVNLQAPTDTGTYILMARVRESGKDASDSFVVPGNETTPAPTTPPAPAGGSSGGGGVIGGVKDSVVCNRPYIRYGKECCLDMNNNSICDRDEVEGIIQENKTTAGGATPEETPKKEFRLFENIKNVLSNFEKSISQNKIYLLAGFGIFIILLGIIVLIIFIIKKLPKLSLSAIGNFSLSKSATASGEVLNSDLEINKRKTEDKMKIKPVQLEVKPVQFKDIDVGGESYLEIKQEPVGSVRNETSSEASEKSVVSKVSAFLAGLWNRHKKYPKNSMLGLVGKKVYSENGRHIGEIDEILLAGNRIESLRIKIDKKHNFEKKGIIIKYRHVKSVGEMVIIDEIISNVAEEERSH